MWERFWAINVRSVKGDGQNAWVNYRVRYIGGPSGPIKKGKKSFFIGRAGNVWAESEDMHMVRLFGPDVIRHIEQYNHKYMDDFRKGKTFNGEADG